MKGEVGEAGVLAEGEGKRVAQLQAKAMPGR